MARWTLTGAIRENPLDLLALQPSIRTHLGVFLRSGPCGTPLALASGGSATRPRCVDASRRSALLCVLVLLAACSTTRREFEIRTRDPGGLLDEKKQQAAYREEFAYVRARRSQLDGARPDVEDSAQHGPPENVIGLALSGGGIRSATFDLGFLQGLRYKDVLDQFDYASAVSGGGYLAAWQQAHLGAFPSLRRDLFAYQVGADSQDDLLRNHEDHVEHLRTHTGFLNQGGWWEGPVMVAGWAWRWPFHLILDDVLHWRGRFKFQHVIDIYRSRIEDTYFRGKPPSSRGVRSIPEGRLVDVNAPGHERLTPYMILNANLSNRGESRVRVNYPKYRVEDEDGEDPGTSWNFEFTRHFTGSDATGYVNSGGFGVPVSEVVERKDVPVSVKVELDGTDQSPFRLSEAVAASGAAFDSLAVGNWIDAPGVSETVYLIGGGVLNLNLGLDSPNFARSYDGWWSIWDYARMVTFQRIPRLVDPGARWLHITDGGHYENLGVIALLRRGARCIVAVDASADPDRRFADLRALRARVRELDLTWATPLPDEGAAPLGRFVVQNRRGQIQAVILYVKASADPTFPHMSEENPVLEETAAQRRVDAIRMDLVAGATRLLAQLEKAAGTKFAICPPKNAKHMKEAAPECRLLYSADERIDPRKESEGVANKVAEISRQNAALEMERKALSTQTDIPTATPTPNSGEATPTAAGMEATPGTEEARTRETKQRLDAIERELQINAGILAGLKQTPPAVRYFEENVKKPFEVALNDLLSQNALGLNDAAQKRWKNRFELVVGRAGERLARVASQSTDPENTREARRERIARILAFGAYSSTFPHNSTLRQWYEWERFEAYRLLGLQMALTYIEPLSPDPEKTTLEWCDFPREYAIGTAPASAPIP